ncbi:GLPGLI family protein [Capnocytophaga sp.]|uniref:GLPGLI family protein n=1 Tax=Capnocytophaga sp. TaxID=44737 RepID=UPI0026DBED85|nr:GLPGLI family protein [Capnocytophaga sp.]MDO5104947.1 GLPGLI family protein [Capnocytophaga sp.]
MKNLIILILLMVFNANIYSQENVVKVDYVTYSTKFPEVVEDNCHLYLTDSKSQFVFLQQERDYRVNNYLITPHFIKYISNYHYKQQEVEDNRTLKDSTILYSRWKNDIVWEIHDDTKEILGYKVQKATTDSFDTEKDDFFYKGKAIAWFTSEIPIPSGPTRYYGLPGLILEVQFEKSNNVWTAKNIDFNSSYTFKEFNKENEVTKNDVVYFFHENPKKIKEIQKQNKKKLKK